MTVTLFGFGPALGLPDISPFCTKVETYMRMAGISFEKKPGNPRQSPKGKLPYLQHDDVRLSDSGHIIQHLATHFPNSLHDPLTLQQQARETLTRSAVEEKLYFDLLYFRWQDESAWTLYKDVIKGVLRKAGVPSFLLSFLVNKIRKDAVGTLHSQGTGRHTPEEITASATQVVDAIAALLGTQAFFFGDAPRVLDATLFAFLDGIITPPLPSPLQTHTQQHDNLVAYVHNIRKQFYAAEAA